MTTDRATEMKNADAAAKAADAAWKQFVDLAYLAMREAAPVEQIRQNLIKIGGLEKARECYNVRIEAHKVSSQVHFGSDRAALPPWEIEYMNEAISDLEKL